MFLKKALSEISKLKINNDEAIGYESDIVEVFAVIDKARVLLERAGIYTDGEAEDGTSLCMVSSVCPAYSAQEGEDAVGWRSEELWADDGMPMTEARKKLARGIGGMIHFWIKEMEAKGEKCTIEASYKSSKLN